VDNPKLRESMQEILDFILAHIEVEMKKEEEEEYKDAA
jgi:hypothetical protein